MIFYNSIPKSSRLWVVLEMIQGKYNPTEHAKFDLMLASLLDNRGISWSSHSAPMFKEENISVQVKDIEDVFQSIKESSLLYNIQLAIKDFITIGTFLYSDNNPAECIPYDLWSLNGALRRTASWWAVSGSDPQGDLEFLPRTLEIYEQLFYIYHGGFLDHNPTLMNLVLNKLSEIEAEDVVRGRALKILY